MTHNESTDFSVAEQALYADECEDVHQAHEDEANCERGDSSSTSSYQSSEEVSEEEEDRELTPTKHKYKKRPRCNFVLDEAEVDDEETDDEAGEGDENSSVIINNEDRERGPTARDIEGHHRSSILFQGIESEAELETYLRNKYGTSTNENVDDEVPEHLIQTSLLPGVKDPCLWLVRCTPGAEQETLLLLSRKIISTLNSTITPPSHVQSVIAPKSARGFLYFEAKKQAYVKQLIEGVSNLKRGQHYIKLVPIKEMCEVLRVTKPQIKRLKPGCWVRPSKGMYKQDLAQVDLIDDIRQVVLLKLIPRLNLAKLKQPQANKNKDLNSEGVRIKVKKRRYEAKLFNPDTVTNLGGKIQRDGDLIVFEGNKFSTQGFLFKEYKINSLVTQGVKPGLDELENFQMNVEELEIDSLELADNQCRHSFCTGDKVIAVGGELKTLVGKVTAIDGNTISMMPSHEEIKEVIEFQASDLIKHYDPGDQVKVITGHHEGNTGLVIRAEENRVIVITDMSFTELELRPQDLSITMTTSSGVDSVGRFQFGDLVNISETMVGVIVRLDRDRFHVLTMNNNLVELKPQTLQIRHQNKKPQALDSEQNPILKKDIVKIINGPSIGLGGTITHIYRGYAFVQCKSEFKNSGLIACRVRNLLLVDGKRVESHDSINLNVQSIEPFMSSPNMRKEYKKTHFPHDQVIRDRTIIGKTVKITAGSYKGNVGYVKDATDSSLRVELMSLCRDVYFDRNHVCEIDGTSSSNFFQTPTNMYGSITPLHTSKRLGVNTPMYQGHGTMTPHYGGSTPNYQPVLSSTWDPDFQSSSNNTSPSNASCINIDMDLSSPYDPCTPSGSDSPNKDLTAPISYSPNKKMRYDSNLIPDSPQYSPSEPASDQSAHNQSMHHHSSVNTSKDTVASVYHSLYGSKNSSQASYSPCSPQYNPGAPYSSSTPQFSPPDSPINQGRISPCSPPFSPLGPDTSSDRESYETHFGRLSSESPTYNNKPWLRPGLCVHVNSKNVDGIVTKVNKMQYEADVTVYVKSMGGELHTSSDNISPSKVEIRDQILIIEGECTGLQGQVLSIEYNDAIVRMHADNIKMIQLQFLCPFKY